MKRLLIFAWVLIAGLSVRAADPIYAVSDYEPKRDPEVDLKQAVKLAGGKRRILLIAGSNSCGWCRRLGKEFKASPEVSKVLHESYVIMKINYDEKNGNLFFLQDYPDIRETPHFFVLDAKGKLLHSRHSKTLEGPFSYRSKAMLNFLKEWVPKRAEAE
jgi:thioredoxin-related protein